MQLTFNKKPKARSDNILRGENHINSKLDWNKVCDIRKLSSEGFSQRKLAKMFNVDRCTIRDIVKFTTWIWAK